MSITADDVQKMTPEQRAQLLRLATPRIVEPYIKHIPHPKQQFYLSLTQREVMFGGAAGPGKSDALLMSALQYVDVPGYSALLLRRTWPDLSLPGAIMDRAREWLQETDATPREGGRRWVFPSGARLQFGHLQYDKDKYSHQSAEYQFIGFDELTQFAYDTYSWMFSRLRKPSVPCLNCGAQTRRYISGWKHTNKSDPRASRCPSIFPDPKSLEQYKPAPDGTTIFDVPLRMRSATNPGGIGHEWVKERFMDVDTKDPRALFVPALLKDNPYIN